MQIYIYIEATLLNKFELSISLIYFNLKHVITIFFFFSLGMSPGYFLSFSCYVKASFYNLLTSCRDIHFWFGLLNSYVF